MKRIWARIACFFTDHRWVVLRTNARKYVVLGWFHPRAGLDTDCTRCGKEWRDA